MVREYGCDGLPDDRVDVWYGLCGDSPVPDRQEARWSILSADEWERCERFARDRDRRQFAAARVLVRRVLSRYAAVEPEAWEFAYSSLGKPSIAPRFGLSDLRFNAAHTRDLVACAVARWDDVGVDAECLDHEPGPLVARHSLSEEEMARYEQLRPIEQNRYFFRHWTLKEAYAKARGLGLSLPFPHISFTVTSNCGAVVADESASPSEPASWQFFHTLVTPRHCLAVAVRRPAHRETRFLVSRWQPWDGGGEPHCDG